MGKVCGKLQFLVGKLWKIHNVSWQSSLSFTINGNFPKQTGGHYQRVLGSRVIWPRHRPGRPCALCWEAQAERATVVVCLELRAIQTRQKANQKQSFLFAHMRTYGAGISINIYLNDPVL